MKRRVEHVIAVEQLTAISVEQVLEVFDPDERCAHVVIEQRLQARVINFDMDIPVFELTGRETRLLVRGVLQRHCHHLRCVVE